MRWDKSSESETDGWVWVRLIRFGLSWRGGEDEALGSFGNMGEGEGKGVGWGMGQREGAENGGREARLLWCARLWSDGKAQSARDNKLMKG